MLCSDCGIENLASSKFCVKCGSKLQQGQPATPKTSTAVEEREAGPIADASIPSLPPRYERASELSVLRRFGKVICGLILAVGVFLFYMVGRDVSATSLFVEGKFDWATTCVGLILVVGALTGILLLTRGSKT